jgi:iron complex outermembrane receptor protein
LSPEHAIGLDLSMRWRGSRASGEVTYFRNDIRDFIFRSPVSLEDLENREADLAERFPSRELDLVAVEEFPAIEYISADSILQGIEAHGDFALTSHLFAEASLDYVRGTLKVIDEPLPRMPPMRGQFGLRYQYNAFQLGGNVIATATQDRLFEGETPTDGYQLLKLFAAYSVQSGRLLHTLTARADNVTHELYRNHLSLIKDLAPEMGRDFKLVYNVRF